VTSYVPPARHLLRSKDLAGARSFELPGVDGLAYGIDRDPSANPLRVTEARELSAV
jgi:hypothetical protein